MDRTMLIGGEWVEASSGATAAVTSPFDRSSLGTVPLGAREDVRRAIDAAREAFDKGPWPRLPPRGRSEVFLKAATLLQQRLGEIAELESR
ncbi:MAG: aldehyde dehydrogenase family protein, partial [Thermoplasmata archaeon]